MILSYALIAFTLLSSKINNVISLEISRTSKSNNKYGQNKPHPQRYFDFKTDRSNLVRREATNDFDHNLLREMKIIGGVDAEKQEFPFMVKITLCDNNDQGCILCGGALIRTDYVLTAAHLGGWNFFHFSFFSNFQQKFF